MSLSAVLASESTSAAGSARGGVANAQGFPQDMNSILFKNLLSDMKIPIIYSNIMDSNQNKNIATSNHPALSTRMPCLNPVYPPHYDEMFLDVKDRVLREDYSAETNALIEEVLKFGETNYMCWVAKKRIFLAGNTTIEHEDYFSASMLLDDNYKNFQLWDFRNFIIEVTKDYEREFQLMDRILMESPKNYHLWSHRTRVAKMAVNFSQQIENTEKYIALDSYNNSAWTYRAFCFTNQAVRDYKAEIEFVLQQIHKYIDNEAAWNYLRGMFPGYKLRTMPCTPVGKSPLLSYDDYPEIKEFCKAIVQNTQWGEKKKVQALLTMVIIDSHSSDSLEYAKQICRYLAELEPMRESFYKWLENAL